MLEINTESIFILSGPSGAGEDSIIDGLSDKIELERVITTTTREMRPNESEGNPYHFVSVEEFKKGIKSDEFFEYALQNNGHYYGVTNKEIRRISNIDKVGIWKIDYKGVITAKSKLKDIIAIMIYAPLEVIEKRVRNRYSQVEEEVVQSRMEYAQGWFEHEDLFDFKVENKQQQLDKAVNEVLDIIKSECPPRYLHFK